MTIIDQTIVGLLLHLHGARPKQNAAEANAKVGTVLEETFTRLADGTEPFRPVLRRSRVCH